MAKYIYTYIQEELEERISERERGGKKQTDEQSEWQIG